MERHEWLKWRHQGIGGSDAPIIMGVSNYATPLELFEEKILPEPGQEGGNYATQKGDRYEPQIRNIASLTQGIDFQVALCQVKEHPWRKASLDGRSECKTIICEIKVNDMESHSLAVAGKVPEKHIPQVFHNIDVANAEKCLYISYNDPNWSLKAKGLPTPEWWKDGTAYSQYIAYVWVTRDEEYMAKLFKEEENFWVNHVLKKKPPVPIARDYKLIRGHAKVANKWKQLKRKMKELEAEMEPIEEALEEIAKNAEHPRLNINGIKMMQVPRVGNINWNKVKEDFNLPEDLDKYRGKGTTYWKKEEMEE